MKTAVTLLLASAIVGLATGLFLRVWILLVVSSTTAIVAATVLQTSGFGFWTGVPIVVGCVVIGQLAYLLAGFARSEFSVQDEVDGPPGEHGHRDVDDKNE